MDPYLLRAIVLGFVAVLVSVLVIIFARGVGRILLPVGFIIVSLSRFVWPLVRLEIIPEGLRYWIAPILVFLGEVLILVGALLVALRARAARREVTR